MAALAVLAIVISAVLVLVNQPAKVSVSDQFVAGVAESDGSVVQLDTSLFLPAAVPAPAVLLAHGLGGTKADLVTQARDLARHGYVVLTYTARGFGRSGGLIHLDSLQYEVADGSKLLDWLQQRPEVERRSGVPVVGVAGSSYGGALALMLGAVDHRVDAVAADITWNNLATALFPNNAVAADGAGSTGTAAGVYKKLWTSYLFSFSMGSGGAVGSDGSVGSVESGPSAGPGCGRFAPDICKIYQQMGVAQTAQAAAAVQTANHQRLLQSSPTAVLSRMRAPTLLTQGEQDSLFPLSEADANAKQIAQAGAPVQVRWRAGGHDAGDNSDSVDTWQRAFFDQHLKSATGSDDGAADSVSAAGSGGFLLSERGAGISGSTGRAVNTTLRAVNGYPGLPGNAHNTASVALTGPTQVIDAPPGGSPAAVSSSPGLGQLLNAAASAGAAGAIGAVGLSELPGQTATFSTAALPDARLIVGSSKVSLTIAALPRSDATQRVSNATLFVSLRDIAPDGASTLPANLVAPVNVELGAAQAKAVSIDLPWIVTQIPAGHRLAVVVSTTDSGYAMPADARAYTVTLNPSQSQLTIPVVATKTIRNGSVLWWPISAGLVLLVCAGYLGWRFRSRRQADRDPLLADVPVAVSNLVKEYSDGYRAVDGVTFRVERGQVVGLLGPNGAGKTTTLRVLMGLIMPTEGSVRVFGEEVVPGASVLSSLGAFVEGPGLLPHLSGRENLELYWAASGRPREAAEFDTVLEIAGLGSSLDRRVKTFSHGMQQRLAIAQAMLGLPEVLVLDEPTNGLDPPQIAEMREVLHRYAASGRTVIISSHLLAEVEQTCTHLVVMARGRLVAAGSVAEVAGAGAEQLVVPDAGQALDVLSAAGISARAVPARRALEDVFLDLIGERHE